MPFQVDSMAHPFNDLKLVDYSGMRCPLFFSVLTPCAYVYMCSHWHIWRLKLNVKMAGLVWSKSRFVYQMTSSASPVITKHFFIYTYSLIIYTSVGRIALPIMLRSRVFESWFDCDQAESGVMTFASYRYQAIWHSPLSITCTPPLLCTDTRYRHWHNSVDTLLSMLSIEATAPPSRKGNTGIIDLVLSTRHEHAQSYNCPAMFLWPPETSTILWSGWRP